MIETVRECGVYPLEERFENLVEAGSGEWS